MNETVFWRPDATPPRIVRTGRVQDVEDGLSEFPHVIVNQARMHDYLLESMRRSPSRLGPITASSAPASRIDETGHESRRRHAARADAARDGRGVHFRARYVVGCDGARSAVASRSAESCAVIAPTMPGA